MNAWRIALGLTIALALPVTVAAAPEGKIVIAQGVDPTTLDIMNQQETPASVVGNHIFDGLVERDQSLKLVPSLAAELPRLINPTTWEIKLRRGVKFHNGEDFTADSVKFSLERLANQTNKLRGSSSFAPIDHVEIVDPSTVRVVTKKPWPVFISHMALRQASMYPPKEYAGKDTAAISKNPIGTGPYKFVRWAKDECLDMQRDYEHKPRLEEGTGVAVGHNDPARQGALRATRIDGSRVVFTRAHGPDGAFDVLTGQFVEP